MQKGVQRKKEESEKLVYMPGDAIKSLRLELSNLLGEKLAAGVLFRFGFRCGEELVERVELENPQTDDIHRSFPLIWEKTGLGKIAKIMDISDEEVEIKHEDSIEAKVLGKTGIPSCDYTRGYLAGMATKLLNKKFYCVETDCISEGKDNCKFQLLVFPHKVLVAKKSD